MGYQVVSATVSTYLDDEAWLELIALASKYEFSAPKLGLLGQREDTDLSEEEAEGLLLALERALWAGAPAEHRASEDVTLDRETVRDVVHVLRQPGVKVLRHRPPWL